MVAHSVTRGWQDIGILLGLMGATQPPIPCPTEGCLVISVMLSYRHFSKTYPRKGTPSYPPAPAHRAKEARDLALHAAFTAQERSARGAAGPKRWAQGAFSPYGRKDVDGQDTRQ